MTMASISNLLSTSSAGSIQGTAAGKPSVALQDKLARCVRQLGDWQACPSGKTPEGKQIIQNLQTQIRSIESRIASAGNGTSPLPSAGAAFQVVAQDSNAAAATGLNSIGSLVNAYA